jgi:hypothetical protein
MLSVRPVALSSEFRVVLNLLSFERQIGRLAEVFHDNVASGCHESCAADTCMAISLISYEEKVQGVKVLPDTIQVWK